MAYSYGRELGIGKKEVLDIVEMRCDECSWEKIKNKYHMDERDLQNQIYDIIFDTKCKRRASFDTPLANWLRENQLRTSDLAAMTGLHKKTIQKIACHSDSVSRDTLISLSEITGIPVDGFYKDDRNKK